MLHLDTNHLPIIRVAAGLILWEGRYLITRRKVGVHLGGFWEFPGGKCELGESLEDCLRRELREELGIEVSSPKQFHTIQHQYPEKVVALYFFRCELAGGETQALDCEEYRWVWPEHLGEYAFPPADRPLVEMLQQLPPAT